MYDYNVMKILQRKCGDCGAEGINLLGSTAEEQYVECTNCGKRRYQ